MYTLKRGYSVDQVHGLEQLAESKWEKLIHTQTSFTLKETHRYNIINQTIAICQSVSKNSQRRKMKFSLLITHIQIT